ncbi:MAG: hypothetical protein HOP10_09975 [Chitinophagaceae bacterium]|nr:hypothetical protein [Chitinophagaceae bacterium]
MKARILSLTALIFSLSFLIVSCQKDASDDQTDYSAETATHSDDDSRFADESDAASDDVLGQLEFNIGFSGRGGQVQTICDATVVVDTLSNPRTITITFNGTPCLPGRTRTGVIVVSMAQNIRWRDAGAVINVTFQNFRITRTRDNKSITFNGTQAYTNVSGGLLINLPTLNTITHTITSNNMSITFDNGSQRTWSVARRRVFTYNNGVVVTVTGMHSQGGITGIAEWGTNRFGRNFTTAITQPVVRRQDCSFRVGSGKVTHTTPAFTASATFGLDATGNPTGCPGANPYYLKAEWTRPNGTTYSTLIPY